MDQVFHFPDSVKRDPAIEIWMEERAGELGTMARHWFDGMRACGDDVRELMHDGHPTACVAAHTVPGSIAAETVLDTGLYELARVARISCSS